MPGQTRAVVSVLLVLPCLTALGADPDSLLGTRPLTLQGDLSAQMVAGIDRFLDAVTERSVKERQKFWQRSFSSVEAYEKSGQTNRESLRRIIGAVDQRAPAGFTESTNGVGNPIAIAETDSFTMQAVL